MHRVSVSLAVLFTLVLAGCTSEPASQNPVDMAATFTAGQTATAAASTPTSLPATPVPAASAKPAPAAAAAGPPEVKMVEPPFQPQQTWTFEPGSTTVKVGTKVTWENTGVVAHTATADDGKSFDSGTVDPKASFSFTFTSPGTFAYHCTFHPWMKGTVTVTQ